MLDELAEDFNIYYAELKNFTERFRDNSHEIESDKLLSRAGKFGQVEKLKTSHLKNINDLGERFNSDFGKRLVDIDDRVKGVKRDPVLDSIKKKYLKGEDISSDESSKLLLLEMRETKTIMRKSNFQNMLSNADNEQVRKTAQSLNDSKDVEKLIWLKELTDLKGQELLSNTMQAQINGIRDEGLSEEQKSLKIVSEKIEKGIKLFEYSLERSKTGVFVDARQDAEV